MMGIFQIPQTWRARSHETLSASIPAVALLLFLAVAVMSVSSIALTRSSLNEFRDNVFSHASTSNDSSLASAMVAYKLSEYLRGEDAENQLRARMDVLTTQLDIAETKFPGTLGEYAANSRDAWKVARVELELILEGDRDPQLIDSTFEHLNSTRINSKYAADSWLYDVLSQKLTDAHNRLETQARLFSIYAPIGAIA